MLEPLTKANTLEDVIERINILTEYVTLEMTQTLPEDKYVRLRGIRTMLGIKL
jgi:hypothetical protein